MWGGLIPRPGTNLNAEYHIQPWPGNETRERERREMLRHLLNFSFVLQLTLTVFPCTTHTHYTPIARKYLTSPVGR